GDRDKFIASIERIFNIFPDLKRLKNLKARNLSGGQQKMLAIACGLIKNPLLLLLDEPSEGLSPSYVKKVVDVIGKLRDEEGVTILLVEQNFNAVKSVADDCYIMDKGRIVYESNIEKLLKESEIIMRYLGISF
ncbi:ABC transporter ATP-binding protein, partial [Candidatus Geothermarchaeota archaeon]